MFALCVLCSPPARVRDAKLGQAEEIRVLAGDNRAWQVSDDPAPLGYAALAEGWCPSGLVCVNDGVASGAIRPAAEQGLLPGQDFAVLGFDDEARARVAVRLLLDHRQGHRRTGALYPVLPACAKS